MAMTLKQAQERIKELEGMVAMGQPPDCHVWPTPICYFWREEQKKIQRKLDGAAKRMRKEKNNGE